MRISGKRRYSFEDRACYKSKQGTLTAGMIAEAVERIEGYTAKAKALSDKSDQVYAAAPRDTLWHGEAEQVRTLQAYDDVIAKLDRIHQQAADWRAKAERLSAIPEVKAALGKTRGSTAPRFAGAKRGTP